MLNIPCLKVESVIVDVTNTPFQFIHPCLQSSSRKLRRACCWLAGTVLCGSIQFTLFVSHLKSHRQNVQLADRGDIFAELDKVYWIRIADYALKGRLHLRFFFFFLQVVQMETPTQPLEKAVMLFRALMPPHTQKQTHKHTHSSLTVSS